MKGLALVAVLALLAGVAVMTRRGLLPAPVERIQVDDTIVGIPAGDAYAWLVHRGHDVALVDAGSDLQANAIIAELAALGLNADDVTAILVTHGHRDHYAGSAVFKNAEVFIGEQDHYLIRGDRLPQGLWSKLTTRLAKKPSLPQRIRDVLPGQVVSVGALQFEAIATPGHTKGSMVYRLGDVLFTGDTLVLSGESLDVPAWFLADSREENLRSLARLARLPFKVIADGHHGVAKDGRARFDRLEDD